MMSHKQTDFLDHSEKYIDQATDVSLEFLLQTSNSKLISQPYNNQHYDTYARYLKLLCYHFDKIITNKFKCNNDKFNKLVQIMHDLLLNAQSDQLFEYWQDQIGSKQLKYYFKVKYSNIH